MVDGVDLGAAVEADVIDDFLEVVPLGGNVCAAFSGFDKIEWALDEVALAGGHRALHVAASFETLEVTFGEFGLGVEGVDVGRTSFHHQEDASLRLGGVVDNFGVALKEGGKGD